MRHLNLCCINLLTLALLSITAGRPAASAGSPVVFTVAVKSAYLRNAPSLAAGRVYSVFKGQTFDCRGRTADSSWLWLNLRPNGGGWILAAYGTLTGDLDSLPIMADTMPAAATIPAAMPKANNSAPPASGVRLKFTLTANSAYARSAPTWNGQRLASLFKGQTYTAIARSADLGWIQIDYSGRPLWVGAANGKLSGSIRDLPASEANSGAQPATVPSGPTPTAGARPPLPEWIPVITPRMRRIYEQTAKYGNNPHAFAVAGDCNSEHFIYLERVAGGLFDLSPYPYLIDTKDWFYPSFLRKSVAVSGGFNTASMFNPLWADPKQCRPDEGPFACELRLTRASIVLIELGTGDHAAWRDFENNYRRLIEYALKRGVLPVLRTKADELETQIDNDPAPAQYINSVIRRLGQEYEVPVMDLWLATRGLYNNGLQAEGKRNFHLSGEGVAVHTLITLQTLDVIIQP